MSVTEENKSSKVAGVFKDEKSAQSARQKLIDSGSFSVNVIEIVAPEDQNLSQKIEPNTQEIATTLVKSHSIIGAIGLLVGLGAALLLTTIGPDMTQSSPLLTYFALGFVGLLLGMMLAGAVSLRPDHDPLISETVKASENQQWSVIVQTRTSAESDRAEDILKISAQSVKETF